MEPIEDDDTGAPNLDSMFPDELMKFFKRTRQSRIFAALLFPAKPKGYVKATKDLGLYAWNKATAMTLSEQGHIYNAMEYENTCERIYNRLPKFAKW